jgi:HAD superfamily hydrolase (TIGR01509 family)
MSAILFGSISTVADTSELQRQAFNQAFAAHGLDWHWDREDYRASLVKSGGVNRIANYASERGETVDASAVHATKSDLFQRNLATVALEPRPGVVETIKAAKSGGWKLGLVTTTSVDNVTALLNALSSHIARQDFDLIVDSSLVEAPKPDKSAYTFALRELGEEADSCIAIEDNADGVAAAVAAGVACVAFPNENTVTNDLTAADRSVDHLDAGELQQLVQAN